jgi:hypothetical protein
LSNRTYPAKCFEVAISPAVEVLSCIRHDAPWLVPYKSTRDVYYTQSVPSESETLLGDEGLQFPGAQKIGHESAL